MKLLGTFGLVSFLLLSLSAADSGSGGQAQERNGLFVVPVVYYTPETGIVGGLTGLYYFREGTSKTTSRPSTLRTALIYSENRQLQLQFLYDLYLHDEKYLVDGELSYSHWPNRFYGIGNHAATGDLEPYTSDNLMARLRALVQIRPGFYLGSSYEFRNVAMTETEREGMLANDGVTGSAGGSLSGLGFFVMSDTRNSPFSASRGYYAQLVWQLYSSVLGSRFDCSVLRLDARRYFALAPDQVAAVQILVGTSLGAVPFFAMPMIGGQDLLRGFFQGRYRDKSLLAVQAEYRLNLVPRLDVVAFGGLGQVAAGLDRLAVGGFKTCGGLGLRYAFKPREGLKLRLDVGWAENKPAFYLTINEAF